MTWKKVCNGFPVHGSVVNPVESIEQIQLCSIHAKICRQLVSTVDAFQHFLELSQGSAAAAGE